MKATYYSDRAGTTPARVGDAVVRAEGTVKGQRVVLTMCAGASAPVLLASGELSEQKPGERWKPETER